MCSSETVMSVVIPSLLAFHFAETSSFLTAVLCTAGQLAQEPRVNSPVPTSC